MKLFNLQNGKLLPNEHCYLIKELNAIIDRYGVEESVKAFGYLFYMTYPSRDLNPFFDLPEHEKEKAILKSLGLVSFSPEDDEIRAGLAFCLRIYETPTYRAYVGFKKMVDRLAHYMGSTAITDGKDGNLQAIVNAASKFDALRTSFESTYKALENEQKGSARGGANLAYDQK